jgi:curved DNA-binding protein CbpA
MKSLYEILGLKRDCTPQDVRKAYRRMAAKAHPDAGGGRFAWDAISLAHEVLMDPGRRAHYDQTGEIVKAAVDQTVQILMTNLSGAFGQVLMACAKEGLDPTEVDFIGQMIVCLGENITGIEKQLPQMRKGLDVLQRLEGRFEVKDDAAPNHMETIVRAQVKGLLGQIENAVGTVANMVSAKAYLQGCKFRGQEPDFDMVQISRFVDITINVS